MRLQTGHRDSEPSPSENEKTSTSGGYTDISESGGLDDSSRGPDQEDEGDYGLEEDYEDDEDRLIAQGGMGIPLDEVRNLSQSSH